MLAQKRPNLLSKTPNNIFLKYYYKKYRKILTTIIQLAKKLHYNKLTSQSSNKTKTAWNVIKSLINDLILRMNLC
jgi:hypothetical protein